MNLVLTSPQHAGKTTACRRLVGRLRALGLEVGGVLAPDDQIEALDGGEMQLQFDRPQPDTIPVGVYHLSSGALEMAEAAIRRSAASGRITIIDEYGWLEWAELGLHAATVSALATGRCLVLVREPLLERFLKRFSEHLFAVVQLHEINRDDVPSILAEHAMTHWGPARASADPP